MNALAFAMIVGGCAGPPPAKIERSLPDEARHAMVVADTPSTASATSSKPAPAATSEKVNSGAAEVGGDPPEWNGKGLQMQLEPMRSDYGLGEMVPFTLEIGNIDADSVSLGLNYAGRVFTVLVMHDLPGQVVDTIRLVQGRVPPKRAQGSIDLAGRLDLARGAFKRWRIGWPCESREGEVVSPGRFRAKAVLASYDHHLESNEVHFRLQGK